MLVVFILSFFFSSHFLYRPHSPQRKNNTRFVVSRPSYEIVQEEEKQTKEIKIEKRRFFSLFIIKQ
jgi:hypothetical protein